MLKTKTVIGAAAVNDATHDYAFMVKNVTGAQLSIVTGYKGTSDIGLAMERREVDGSCGWDWASFKSQRGALDQGRPDQCAYPDRPRSGRGIDPPRRTADLAIHQATPTTARRSS